MKTSRVKFTNSDGQQLAAELEFPVTGKPRAWALFAHCFTCTRNLRAAKDLSNALSLAGFGVMRFDFTGLGQSEGEFADSNFSTNVDDLVSAADYLASEQGAPQLLVGHSLGGTACLVAAPSILSCRAVATIGSPATASHVAHLLGDNRETIEREGQAEVLLAGRPFTIKKQFLDDIESQELPGSLRSLRRALLVMHAPLDELVSIDNAGEIFSNAMHPKSFVALDGADHLLSASKDSTYAGQVLAAWAARYLDLAEDVGPVAAEGEVAVRTESGGFYTQIDAAGHRMVADEPPAVGGTNLGPTPYGLLSAALGACTTMTLQMYARRKKLPLEAVTVHVRHEKRHADDCEADDGKIDTFDREIVITGDLDQPTRSRLVEIADMCPVHRTLHSSVKVNTRLRE